MFAVRMDGNGRLQDLEAGDVAAIIECPKCYRSLGVVLYPNLQETKEAAAQGNEEAIKALPSFESRVKAQLGTAGQVRAGETPERRPTAKSGWRVAGVRVGLCKRG